MLSRVAELTKKTKAMAETALEALDAHDSDLEDNPADIDPDLAFVTGTTVREKTPEQRFSVVTAQSQPHQSKDEYQGLLAQLVKALSGRSDMNTSDLAETTQVLTTHIGLVREQASSSAHMQGDLKELFINGSLIAALMHVVETKGDETAASLLDALETEQAEHAKTRHRLTSELRRVQREKVDDSVLKKLEAREVELERVNNELSASNSRNEELSLESQKLNRMLTKVVKEKADLQVELDNEDKIDARVVRSAFVQLCCQVDNKKLRNNVINVMADILQLSEEDRLRASLRSAAASPSSTDAPVAEPPGLAKEFLIFLQEEVKDPELEI